MLSDAIKKLPTTLLLPHFYQLLPTHTVSLMNRPGTQLKVISVIDAESTSLKPKLQNEMRFMNLSTREKTFPDI